MNNFKWFAYNKKLLSLYFSYIDELKSGNYEHLKDFVACIVLAPMLKYCELPISKGDITLGTLIKTDYDYIKFAMKVPKEQELSSILKEYNEVYGKGYWRCGFSHYGRRYIKNIDKTCTAIEWELAMLKAGMISEGQTIHFYDYDIVDFITDKRLASLFCDEKKCLELESESLFQLIYSGRSNEELSYKKKD